MGGVPLVLRSDWRLLLVPATRLLCPRRLLHSLAPSVHLGKSPWEIVVSRRVDCTSPRLHHTCHLVTSTPHLATTHVYTTPRHVYTTRRHVYTAAWPSVAPLISSIGTWRRHHHDPCLLHTFSSKVDCRFSGAQPSKVRLNLPNSGSPAHNHVCRGCSAECGAVECNRVGQQ